MSKKAVAVREVEEALKSLPSGTKEALQKVAPELLRDLGVVPPCRWYDAVSLGLTHDVSHIRTKGTSNKLVGMTNVLLKAAAAAYGGYKAWRYFKPE